MSDHDPIDMQPITSTRTLLCLGGELNGREMEVEFITQDYSLVMRPRHDVLEFDVGPDPSRPGYTIRAQYKPSFITVTDRVPHGRRVKNETRDIWFLWPAQRQPTVFKVIGRLLAGYRRSEHVPEVT